jgi:geranylgeranyl pyrophosphate synthase
MGPAPGSGRICASVALLRNAAALAARTDNPRVVAIFSELLQQLSEGNLRSLFGADNIPFDEERVLYQSATRAGATLAGLQETQIAAIVAWIGDGTTDVQGSDLVAFQRERWGEVMRNA